MKLVSKLLFLDASDGKIFGSTNIKTINPVIIDIIIDTSTTMVQFVYYSYSYSRFHSHSHSHFHSHSDSYSSYSFFFQARKNLKKSGLCHTTNFSLAYSSLLSANSVPLSPTAGFHRKLYHPHPTPSTRFLTHI